MSMAKTIQWLMVQEREARAQLRVTLDWATESVDQAIDPETDVEGINVDDEFEAVKDRTDKWLALVNCLIVANRNGMTMDDIVYTALGGQIDIPSSVSGYCTRCAIPIAHCHGHVDR